MRALTGKPVDKPLKRQDLEVDRAAKAEKFAGRQDARAAKFAGRTGAEAAMGDLDLGDLGILLLRELNDVAGTKQPTPPRAPARGLATADIEAGRAVPEPMRGLSIADIAGRRAAPGAPVGPTAVASGGPGQDGAQIPANLGTKPAPWDPLGKRDAERKAGLSRRRDDEDEDGLTGLEEMCGPEHDGAEVVIMGDEEGVVGDEAADPAERVAALMDELKDLLMQLAGGGDMEEAPMDEKRARGRRDARHVVGREDDDRKRPGDMSEAREVKLRAMVRKAIKEAMK